MYFNASFRSFIMQVYGLKTVGYYGRYGGICGEYINTLGMDATVLFLASLILSFFKRINPFLNIYSIVVSSIIISLSGMRAGLVGIFLSSVFLIFYYKGSSYFARKVLKVILTLLFAAFFFVQFFTDANFQEFFWKRFTLDLLADFHLFSSSKYTSNLDVLKNMFDRTIQKYNNLPYNTLRYIFGFDVNIGHDSVYVNYFLQFGLFALLAFILLLFFLFFLLKKVVITPYIMRELLLFLYFCSVLWLFKAYFPFHNLFMLTMLIILVRVNIEYKYFL
jgi:hypothetical protein